MASFDSTYGSSATTSGMSGSARTLTAFFDSRDDAQDAVSRLRSLGLPESSIRLVGSDSSSTTSSSSYGSTSYHDEHKGFWDSLADFFFPDEDRATYAEGLRRGGYLVTVSNIPDQYYDQALDILDDEGSVDVDSRADQWRSEGWTGASSYASGSSSSSTGYGTGGTMGMGTAAAGAGLTGTERSYDSDTTASSFASGTTSTASTDRAYAGTSDATLRGDRDTEVIPVVEENLRIGKRDVNLGRVRVRSYVVEQPVQEQVNLREERVTIERRPVDRPLTGTENVFTDKVIEAEEHVEEAVVAKEARVKEEIAVRKEAEEHVETVSDTVRRTEVEVEDERTANRLSGDVRINDDRNR
jgi:uncharacterized protein (TIGR02271 family)